MDNEKDQHFYHFLAEGNIICGLNSSSDGEAIAELSGRLSKNTAGLDVDKVVEAVVAREKIMPTVLAPGLAVPHARLANINQMLIAMGTSREGIKFSASGMPPVNVVILILTPKDDPGLHLQVLSALSRDFKDPDTVKKVAARESASEILDFFNSANMELPDYLRAKDVMLSNPVVLKENDSLERAIEVFATKSVMDIPLIDEDNDIRGVIALENILKFSLPEHLLWMDDLSPILHFQPFAEMLRDDKETKIADIMSEEFVSVEQNIPAIQLAKIFLMKNVRQIIVTNNSKFAGVVNMHAFITKLFWA